MSIHFQGIQTGIKKKKKREGGQNADREGDRNILSHFTSLRLKRDSKINQPTCGRM